MKLYANYELRNFRIIDLGMFPNDIDIWVILEYKINPEIKANICIKVYDKGFELINIDKVEETFEKEYMNYSESERNDLKLYFKQGLEEDLRDIYNLIF